MRKIYCGGSFKFDYIYENCKIKAEKDYRSVLLGCEELLLKYSEGIRINGNVEYIGPFYFETDGMQDGDIVRTEWKMVQSCTDAVFLFDEASCPGTVCELTAASMLGKRVHIFYIRKSEGEETESTLHTPCWYPIIHSIAVNKHTCIYEYKSIDDAVAGICDMVKKWE